MHYQQIKQAFGGFSTCILHIGFKPYIVGLESPNVHIHFMYYTKVDRGKGKMVGEQPCPIKYHSLKYIKIRDAPQVKEELFTNLLGCNFRDKNIRGMLLSTKRSSFIFRKVTASQFKGTVSGDFQAFSYEKNST